MTQPIHGPRKKWRLLFKGLAISLAVLVILFLGIIIYVSSNKHKIISQVTSAISKKINGNVKIGDVDLSFFENFPKVAVRVRDISITDTMYQQHKHPFFVGQEVFFTLSLMKLISKQPPVNGVRIKNGGLYLYTDSSGYSNTYLLKSKPDSSSSRASGASSQELTNIRISNFHLIIEDNKRGKFHDLAIKKLNATLDYKNDLIVVHTAADILVSSLAFNLSRGSFMKGKTFAGDFDLHYKISTKSLDFDSIDVKLQDHPFNLSGKFDLGSNAPQFSLRVHTRKIEYETAKTLLPVSISNSLSLVKLDAPVDADADVSGPLKGGEPLLNVAFAAKETSLVTPFMDFTKATFNGSYSNEVVRGLPRTDPNSSIVVKDFTASWHELPVSAGKIQILDLLHPQLSADLNSTFALKELNQMVGSSAIDLQDGTGALNLRYQGPIEKNNNTNSFLDGTIAFKDGRILYAPRNVLLSNVNGSMLFKNSDLYIKKLGATVLGNNITMDGFAKNLLTLVNTEPNKVNIDWNISSPQLNLGNFVYLLKSKNKTAVKKSSGSKLGDVSDKIDNALELSTLNVSLNVGKMIYKKLEATNFSANVKLLQDRYNIDKVSMNFGGGGLVLSGALLNNAGNNHNANLDAQVTNVDVKRLFVAFSNFGQDGITANSLEGKVSAKVKANMMLDDNGQVLPSSIRSVVDFSLKNGALNNFEPIKKLQNILFKNRDFENIRFAELKDKLEINSGEIKINRMEIQSSVLSMFVEGVFSNRGKTDISIQVPLNNLKKRGVDYVPENSGTAGKGGKSLFVRGQPGPDGNIKFKLDLFKKYQKDKAEN